MDYIKNPLGHQKWVNCGILLLLKSFSLIITNEKAIKMEAEKKWISINLITD